MYLQWIQIAFVFLIKILEGIISLSLTLIAIPVFIILWICNQTARFIVSFHLKIKFGGKFVLTDNGLDCIWGYKIPGNSRNVISVVIYETQIDGNKYRDEFLKKVINHTAPNGSRPYEKLTKIFTKAYGYYCFKDDENFDINNHIITLPKDYVYNETDLLRLCADLSEDMDDFHPQWQEIIIPRFKYNISPNAVKKYNNNNNEVDEKSVRILRFNHSYGDAGSWFLLYSDCLCNSQIPFAVNPLEGFKGPMWQKVLFHLNFIIFGATSAIKTSLNAMLVSSRFLTPKYSGKRIYTWSDILDLNTIKQIKKRTNTAIPTIVTSAVAGALRRFDAKYPVKNLNGEIKKLENCIDIGAVAAILPYKKNGKLQNRFTVANFSVPTGEMSSLARLKLTHQNGLALARSPEPLINYCLFKFFGIFPCKIKNFLMKSLNTSVVVSNLPGGKVPFAIGGDVLADGGGWVPLLTCAGFSISAAGYKDGIRFCGVADTACMNEAQLNDMIYEIGQEIKNLEEESIGIV